MIWDNQATMHRAMGYDNKEVRDMRRTTISRGYFVARRDAGLGASDERSTRTNGCWEND